MQSTIPVTTVVRRTIIDMALRRQRPGSGSSIAFLTERTTLMTWPDLSTVLTAVPWAVVGAVATRLYMPERLTRDLDIAIWAGDSAVVHRKLAAAGFVNLGDLSIGGATWETPNGQLIDIIEGRESWWPQALAEAQTNRDAVGLPILPLSYLIYMKMQASRPQDLGDLARMLGQADDDSLNKVRAFFRQYSPDDLEDLESLIKLGKLETQ